MMKTASRSSVAVSFGSRFRNRMTPSRAVSEPATIASPSTRSAFANSEPRMEVCATTTSPAASANRTTKSSGRLPSVDCSTPVSAGPNREPTASVAIPITQASPASAAAATMKTATGETSAKWSAPVTTHSPMIPAKRPAVRPLRPNKAHALVHRLERRRARLAGLARALREHPAQLSLVGAQLLVALLDRRQQLDDGLGDALLERTVALPVELRLDLANRAPGGDGHDLDQVRDSRLILRIVTDLGSRIGDRRLELLAHLGGRVDHPNDAGRCAASRRHQPLRLLEVLDPRTLLGVDGLGNLEGLAETRVETLCDVARELQVLALVVADRDDVGQVEQDVAGHQHGVVEEARRDELLLLGFLLELRHPPQLAEARDGAQQPGGLRVCLNMALDEDGRTVRVEAGREQPGGDGQCRLAEDLRLERRRDRVQVDDAEERVALLLRGDVLPEPAAVVAERLVPGGADAGEDPHSVDYRRDGCVDGAPERADVVAERDRALLGYLDRPRADDDAVGERRGRLRVLRRGDPEAGVERGVGQCPSPGDEAREGRGEAFAGPGRPGERDEVEPAVGLVGRQLQPLVGGSRCNELDAPQVGALAGGQVGDDQARRSCRLRIGRKALVAVGLE